MKTKGEQANMKKLMVIVGCVAVAMLNAVAGTTNQVAVANAAKNNAAERARAEREEQRRLLMAIVCEERILDKEEYFGILKLVFGASGTPFRPAEDGCIQSILHHEAMEEGVRLVVSPRKLEEKGLMVSMMIALKNICSEKALRAISLAYQERITPAAGPFIMFIVDESTIFVTGIDKDINSVLEVVEAID